jgi:Asp/Glu/Hydantoin racemase
LAACWTDAGQIREESRQIYREVILRLCAAGAKGIVLGCTEIELLISAPDSPVPVFATTRLHVEAVVDASLTAVNGTAARPPDIADPGENDGAADRRYRSGQRQDLEYVR